MTRHISSDMYKLPSELFSELLFPKEVWTCGNTEVRVLKRFPQTVEHPHERAICGIRNPNTAERFVIRNCYIAGLKKCFEKIRG